MTDTSKGDYEKGRMAMIERMKNINLDYDIFPDGCSLDFIRGATDVCREYAERIASKFGISRVRS